MGARGPAPSSRRVGRGRGQPAAQLQGCGRLLTQRPLRRRRRCRRLLRLVAGGTGAPSGAGEPALPFAAAAAISAFSGREGGGAPRLQLERAPLRGRSSPPRSACLLPALPAPCALRVQPGPARGEGRGGGGRERPGIGRTRRGKSWIAALRRTGCTPVGPPAVAAAGRGSPAGTRGRCGGGGPGCPGAKLWGTAPPGPVPSSARSSLPAPHTRPWSRGTRAFSGRGGHACPCRENFSCRLCRGGRWQEVGQGPLL